MMHLWIIELEELNHSLVSSKRKAVIKQLIQGNEISIEESGLSKNTME